jgi:hypothetical protein
MPLTDVRKRCRHGKTSRSARRRAYRILKSRIEYQLEYLAKAGAYNFSAPCLVFRVALSGATAETPGPLSQQRVLTAEIQGWRRFSRWPREPLSKTGMALALLQMPAPRKHWCSKAGSGAPSYPARGAPGRLNSCSARFNFSAVQRRDQILRRTGNRPHLGALGLTAFLHSTLV